MKKICAIFLILGITFFLQAQTSISYNDTKDYLIKYFNSNVLPPQEDEYQKILDTHDKEKDSRYTDSAFQYIKEYLRYLIDKSEVKDSITNIDINCITHLSVDSITLNRNLNSLLKNPITSVNYSTGIPKYSFNMNTYYPSYSALDFPIINDSDTSHMLSIFRRYTNLFENKNILYINGFSNSELEQLYKDNLEDINKIQDNVLKVLLLVESELFIYKNSRNMWSEHYFYNYRIKEIEAHIASFTPINQDIIYYFIGRMFAESWSFKKAYKYYYKSYYMASRYSTTSVYSQKSLYSLYYITSFRYENINFRNKKYDLLKLNKAEIFQNESDSINRSMLMHLSVLNNILDDSTKIQDKQTRILIYIYSIFDLSYDLHFAQIHNLQIDDRIASQVYNEMANFAGTTYNNPCIAQSYYAFSLRLCYSNTEYVNQAVVPLSGIIYYLLKQNNLSDARKMIDIQLDIANRMNSTNYITPALCHLTNYYIANNKKDSVDMIKSILDSMYYNGLITSQFAINRYQNTLQKITPLNKKTSINKIYGNSILENDYTLEYADYIKIEQEAKAEIDEVENKKVLAQQKDYEKYLLEVKKDREREDLRKSLNDSIEIKNREVKAKEATLQKLRNDLFINKQQLSTTKKELSSRLDEVSELNGIIEQNKNLIESQNTLIIRQSFIADSLQKEINIKLQNKQNVINYGSLIAFVIITLLYLYFNRKLNRETEEKIEANKQAALYESNFFKDIIDFHPQKSGLPTISAKINWLKIKVDDMWDVTTQTELSNDLDKIIDIVNKYASYMENLLSNSKEERITLQQELASCEQYLDFIKLSNEKNIMFDYSRISGHENLSIPPNILIPFVENCNRHAFKNKSASDNLITIYLNNNGKGFDLVFMDNGSGITKLSDTKSSGASLFSLQKFLNKYNIIKNTKYYFDVNDNSCRNNIIENGTIKGSFVKIKNIVNG